MERQRDCRQPLLPFHPTFSHATFGCFCWGKESRKFTSFGSEFLDGLPRREYKEKV